MPPYCLTYLTVDLTLSTSFRASKIRMMPSPLDRVAAEAVDHVVGIGSVAEQVAAARQGREFRHIADGLVNGLQTRPRILIEIAHHRVGHGTAPDLHRIEICIFVVRQAAVYLHRDMRVANEDCCPSRNVRSLILRFLAIVIYGLRVLMLVFTVIPITNIINNFKFQLFCTEFS